MNLEIPKRILYINKKEIDKFNKYGLCIATCSGKIVFCHTIEEYGKLTRVYDGVWRVYLTKNCIFDKSPVYFNNKGIKELWELRIIN